MYSSDLGPNWPHTVLTVLILMVTVSGNPNPTNVTNTTTKYRCEFDILNCLFAIFHPRAISERFRDKELIIKRYINSSSLLLLYYTFGRRGHFVSSVTRNLQVKKKKIAQQQNVSPLSVVRWRNIIIILNKMSDILFSIIIILRHLTSDDRQRTYIFSTLMNECALC